MRYCSSCGASLREGAKFCPACGTVCTEEAPAPAVCPACGAPLEKGDAFGLSCGAKIADGVKQAKRPAQNAAAPKPKKPKNRKNRKIALISVITAAVLLLGAGGFFLIRHLTGANDPLKRVEKSVDVHAVPAQYAGTYTGTVTFRLFDPDTVEVLEIPAGTAEAIDGISYDVTARLGGERLLICSSVFPLANDRTEVIYFDRIAGAFGNGVWQSDTVNRRRSNFWSNGWTCFRKDGSLFVYLQCWSGYGKDTKDIAAMEFELKPDEGAAQISGGEELFHEIGAHPAEDTLINVPDEILSQVDDSADPEDYLGSYVGAAGISSFGPDRLMEEKMRGLQTSRGMMEDGFTCEVTAEFDGEMLSVSSPDKSLTNREGTYLNVCLDDIPHSGIYQERSDQDTEHGLHEIWTRKLCFLQDGGLYVRIAYAAESFGSPIGGCVICVRLEPR